MKIFFILIIFIFLIFVKSDSENIDLSDENPLVYCLKKVRNYNLDEIKDFVLRNQDPEYAIDHYPNDDMFRYCMEQLSKEDY